MKRIWRLLPIVLCVAAAAQNGSNAHTSIYMKNLSPAEQEVWAQEETYWQSLKADDRETYLGLWHERFIGWNRYENAPSDKQEIREEVRHGYAPGTTVKGRVLDYKLQPLSVRSYGNGVVITFYRVTRTKSKPKGETETTTSRITHTWMRTDQGWRIIGGMSADDEQHTKLAQSSPDPDADGNRLGGTDHERIQQVLAVDEARRLAMLHGDTNALDSLLAEDATIFWGDGTADNKASTLELFRSGRLHYKQLDYDNTRVQLYGDIAVVTGTARVQAQSSEQALEHTARVTRVYAHNQDRWRLVVSQTTRMDDPLSQSTKEVVSSTHANACEGLATMSISGVSITSASDVAAGHFNPPGSDKVLDTLAFCRVVAVAKPTSDSVINFEVWIPTSATWNQDFLGVGNGGYNGAIQYVELAEALKRGFAAASTDTGHTGADLTFAAGHPEKIIDWGYRAVHVMTESAKLIIRAYSGRLPEHSFFMGCSTGGHQALSEVQRFPADYDGVVAGDPGNNRVHLNVGFLWAFSATHDANGNAILPSSKLPLINKAAINACDAEDGVKDGIISDPQACQFDSGVLLCKGKENDECLTAEQVSAVKKIYKGPKNPRTGEQIIAGYSPGSESPVGDEYEGRWKSYIIDRKEPMRLEFWKYWVFHNADWDWRTFDYDRDVTRADTELAAANASSPDLSAFKARGGKILMYSGWADPVGPPMDAVNYYKRVESAMAGRETTESFFRLFMVPGMAHCRGGPGPNNFGGMSTIASWQNKLDPEHDALSALMQWVEKGVAPEYIIASHVTDDHVDRTRPLCPYPKVARWNGIGTTEDAKNFTCDTKSTK